MFGWVAELESESVMYFGSRVWNLWPILVPLGLILVLALVQWLWWKYNLGGLSTLPGSNCDQHLLIMICILLSVFKNKLTDTNVCEYKCGFV